MPLPAQVHTLRLGEHELSCRFRYSGTPELLASFCTPGGDPSNALSVLPSEWAFWSGTIGAPDAHAEYSLFSIVASDALLAKGCCLLHAAAFSFRGRAWLICAHPGVGKSTQLRLLQELWPGEFSVICGDRPLLQPSESGFLVCPTPWNGKENWHGADAAPLAGILCLSRAEKDELLRLPPRGLVLPLFDSLICSRETEDLVRQMAAFENSLLEAVPGFAFRDADIPSSAVMLHDMLLSFEENADEI